MDFPNYQLDKHPENECRDVALLRLIKGCGQRIIKLGRCLLAISPDNASYEG